MYGYNELTCFTRGKFIQHIVLLKKCPCDQCKEETDKAIAHLRAYDEKAKVGLDLLEKAFHSK
jgi:hypothetical protein